MAFRKWFANWILMVILYTPIIALLRRLGYTADDIKIGVNIDNIIHGDDVQRAKFDVARVINGDSIGGVEYRAIRLDGSTFPVMVFTQPVFEDGVTVGVRGTIIDLSRIQSAGETIKEKDIYYRTLFENTGTALVIVGHDSVVQKCNSRFEMLSGFPGVEIEGKMQWSDFVDPVDLDRLRRYRAKRLSEQRDIPREHDFIFLAQGGIQKHVHMVVMRIPGTKDILCSLSDMTEYKRIQETLRRNEERYSLVLSGSNDGLWDYDLKNGTVYFSPRYKQILGYTDEEFPNEIESWRRNVFPDDLETARAVLKKIIDGEEDHVEYELPCTLQGRFAALDSCQGGRRQE